MLLSNLVLSTGWPAADGRHPESGDQPAWLEAWPAWSPDHCASLNLAGLSTIQPLQQHLIHSILFTGSTGWARYPDWPARSPIGEDRNGAISG